MSYPNNRHFVLLLFACLSLVCDLHGAEKEVVLAIAGDSTVEDALPGQDQAGWGWSLAQMARPGIVIYNEAKGGRSSRSFRTEGRWDELLALHPDWVLIQFGHNDQKGKGPERESDAKTDYRDHLRQYIAEARAAGAQPVLVTPVCRRTYHDDGTLLDFLGKYSDAVKIVAEETGVPYLDLHAYSYEQFSNMTPEASTAFAPGGKHDRTHFSRASSQTIARWVLILMQDKVPELAQHFDADSMPAAAPAQPSAQPHPTAD
jgi:lysophospholipase L1-like esterase